MRRVHEENYGVYRVRKMHAELNRRGHRIARCTVHGLMRADGLRESGLTLSIANSRIVRDCSASGLDHCRVRLRRSLEVQPVRAPLAVAWCVAAAVCFVTFGVMTTLWYALPQNPEVPGHWDYASGTLGDAVVLPLLAAALVCAVLVLPSARRDTTALVAGGVLGLSGGAVVQFSWLADPSPRLNWVVPEAHHFSGPGWYHAVVLVILASGLSGMYGLLISRIQDASLDFLRQARRAVGCFSAAVSVFLFLVILDSTPSATTSSSVTTILICAGGMAVASYPLLLAAGQNRRVLRPTLLAGLFLGLVADAMLLAVCSIL